MAVLPRAFELIKSRVRNRRISHINFICRRIKFQIKIRVICTKRNAFTWHKHMIISQLELQRKIVKQFSPLIYIATRENKSDSVNIHWFSIKHKIANYMAKEGYGKQIDLPT